MITVQTRSHFAVRPHVCRAGNRGHRGHIGHRQARHSDGVPGQCVPAGRVPGAGEDGTGKSYLKALDFIEECRKRMMLCTGQEQFELLQ